jgi:hypothetical protein
MLPRGRTLIREADLEFLAHVARDVRQKLLKAPNVCD